MVLIEMRKKESNIGVLKYQIKLWDHLNNFWKYFNEIFIFYKFKKLKQEKYKFLYTDFSLMGCF